MTPYLIDEKLEECCGCLSCVKVCPLNAISVEQNENGFFLPKLDTSKCVHCWKCTKVCQYAENINLENRLEEPEFIAVQNREKEILNSSSSGGLFMALCQAFLEEHGVVYGATWDDNLQVYHTKAQSIEECRKFNGSKYVISNLGNTYGEIKDMLRQGIRIFFAGTPCQVAGLYTFLYDTDKVNLTTCDLICHGVPSQTIFNDYLCELSKMYGSKVVKVDFKNKEINWRNPLLKIQFENGEIHSEPIWQSSYGRLYHSRFSVMEACNHCKYATMPRTSDITIGDFWGYQEKKHNLGNEKSGISVGVVNTDKGLKILSKLNSYADICKISLNEAMQRHLEKSATAPPVKRYKHYLKLRNKNENLKDVINKIEKEAIEPGTILSYMKQTISKLFLIDK